MYMCFCDDNAFMYDVITMVCIFLDTGNINMHEGQLTRGIKKVQSNKITALSLLTAILAMFCLTVPRSPMIYGPALASMAHGHKIPPSCSVM